MLRYVASAMAANMMLFQYNSGGPISLACLTWSASVLSTASPEPRPVGTSNARDRTDSSLEPLLQRPSGCRADRRSRITASDPIDAARLNLLLNELRLPAIKHLWSAFTERADKEGWPAARLLSALAEHEIAERGQRRIERHLAEARLPPETVGWRPVPT